ncbi:DUF1127 domain-containing protein [Ruegeria meonggei]|uniref:DUF1127 domain-containing protein n=1 Tax=Ruegeria meonggei TaxID=1446476 RepID=A0A1X6ZC38_9RHOB|nr:DUF1127 domain-containing protein [Ruegeria meonggei]SLN47365.1 hypothetical protein RUM8411_02241 [Ruegeria meonggei]
MLDSQPTYDVSNTASAVLLFDRAMRVQAVRSDIVRAAQELGRLSDQQLAEIGINRIDIDNTIERFI